MRRLVNIAVRGVLALSFVMVLSVPAQAQPSEGGGWTWIVRGRDRVVKVVKSWTVRSTGDGLSDPKPKP